MARKRKKRKKRGYSQEVLLLLTGSLLTLCALSVSYGFLIRKSVAEVEIREFQIEVLNGTGEKGLAQTVALALLKMEIDVLHYGNAPEFSHEETILIGRKKKEGLHKLAQALGCRNVIEQQQPDAMVDATLILGADYRTLKLTAESDSGLLE